MHVGRRGGVGWGGEGEEGSKLTSLSMIHKHVLGAQTTLAGNGKHKMRKCRAFLFSFSNCQIQLGLYPSGPPGPFSSAKFTPTTLLEIVCIWSRLNSNKGTLLKKRIKRYRKKSNRFIRHNYWNFQENQGIFSRTWWILVGHSTYFYHNSKILKLHISD